jgi:N-acetyltransferase
VRGVGLRREERRLYREATEPVAALQRRLTPMNMTPVTLELDRGRARLEPMRADHAAGLLAALDDPGIWRYMPSEPPVTLDLMSRMVATALEGQAKVGDLVFVIVDRSDGSVRGSTRYLDVQPSNRSLEIGWTWLSRSAQRTSINTECKFLLLRHAFETLGCVRVQLKCDGRNIRSQEAIARLGGVREGTLRRQRVLWDGFIRDTVYFSILDSEWPTVKERLITKLGGLAP